MGDKNYSAYSLVYLNRLSNIEARNPKHYCDSINKKVPSRSPNRELNMFSSVSRPQEAEKKEFCVFALSDLLNSLKISLF